MCKTIQDSVFSGSLSYLTGIILCLTGKPKYIWAGVFILVVGTVQWLDAAIWYAKQNNIPAGNITKHGISTVLALEILSGYAGYVYYYGKRMPYYEPFAALVILHLIFIWPLSCEEPTVSSAGYLQWCGGRYEPEVITPVQYFYRTVMMFFIFFPFFFYPDIGLRNLILIVGFVLWLHALTKSEFGSRWCHSFYIADLLILAKLGLGL